MQLWCLAEPVQKFWISFGCQFYNLGKQFRLYWFFHFYIAIKTCSSWNWSSFMSGGLTFYHFDKINLNRPVYRCNMSSMLSVNFQNKAWTNHTTFVAARSAWTGHAQSWVLPWPRVQSCQVLPQVHCEGGFGPRCRPGPGRDGCSRCCALWNWTGQCEYTRHMTVTVARSSVIRFSITRLSWLMQISLIGWNCFWKKRYTVQRKNNYVRSYIVNELHWP